MQLGAVGTITGSASEAFIGAVALLVILAILAVALGVRFIINEYSSLNKTTRSESRDREDRLQKTLDKTVDSMTDITESLRKVNESVAKQSHETNVAINAINQTTTQLGNTVTTLTLSVENINTTLGFVVEKVTEQERRDLEYAKGIASRSSEE